MGYLKHLY